MSYAHITVLGNVGNDPEIKKLANGAITARFSLAHNKPYTMADGTKDKKVIWFPVECYQAKDTGLVTGVIQPWVKKGQKVLVTGDPVIEDYTDKEGQARRIFKIRLGPNATLSLEGGPRTDGAAADSSASSPAANGSSSGTMPNDDIPF